MGDWWQYGIALLAVIAVGYLTYRVGYARAYDHGYMDSREDSSLPGLKGVIGVCGKCGWEAPQTGDITETMKMIIGHDCDADDDE